MGKIPEIDIEKLFTDFLKEQGFPEDLFKNGENLFIRYGFFNGLAVMFNFVNEIGNLDITDEELEKYWGDFADKLLKKMEYEVNRVEAETIKLFNNSKN